MRLIVRNGSMSNPKEKLDFVLLLKLLKIATLTDDAKDEDEEDHGKVDNFENSDISGKNNVTVENTYFIVSNCRTGLNKSAQG